MPSTNSVMELDVSCDIRDLECTMERWYHLRGRSANESKLILDLPAMTATFLVCPSTTTLRLGPDSSSGSNMTRFTVPRGSKSWTRSQPEKLHPFDGKAAGASITVPER